MSLIRETGNARMGWAFALALLPSIAVLMDGLNNSFGDSITCLAFSALLGGLLLLDPPPTRVWRRARVVMACIGCAIGWAGFALAWPHPIRDGSVPFAPDLGWPALVGVVGYVAALLCGMVAGARRMRLGRFLDWLLLFGCAGLTFALLVRNDPGASSLLLSNYETGRFYGTLSNANAAAAYYATLAVLALSRALRDGDALWAHQETASRRLLAASYWLALLFLIGGCLLTASRSGIVLAAAAIMVLLLHDRRRRLMRSGKWMGPLIAGAMVALVAGYAGLLLERFAQLPGEIAVRMLLWKHNWYVAWQSPLFGFGLGGFPEVNDRYLGQVRQAQAIWMTNSPHNIMLRLMIDAGLPYLVLIMAAGIAILIRIVRAARARSLDEEELGLLLAAAIMLGSSLIDIALEVPALCALMMIWIGLLWGRALVRHDDVGVSLSVVHPVHAKRLIPR